MHFIMRKFVFGSDSFMMNEMVCNILLEYTIALVQYDGPLYCRINNKFNLDKFYLHNLFVDIISIIHSFLIVIFVVLFPLKSPGWIHLAVSRYKVRHQTSFLRHGDHSANTFLLSLA